MKKRAYIYSLGYSSYEESFYKQFSHEQKFSQQEFDKIIIDLSVTILKERKEDLISFQHIFFEVIEKLKEKGFKELKFTAKFNVFGWANLLDPNDWKSDREKQLNQITKEILKHKKRVNTQEILYKF